MRFVAQLKVDIELLGAEVVMGDLPEQIVEAVIDDKDQLPKIINGKIQLVRPGDAALFYIWRQKAAVFLLDNVEHAVKLAAVAVYQVVLWYLPQVLDAVNAEVVKNAERV